VTWNNTAHWTGAVVPGLSDDVTILNTANTSVSMTMAVAAANLTINSLTITSVGTLVARSATLAMSGTGSLNVTGGVVLNSNGTLGPARITGGGSLNAGGTISGTGQILANSGTLNLTAAGMTGTLSMSAASNAANVLNLNLTGGTSNTVTAIAINVGATFNLGQGTLTAGSVGGTTHNGTIKVSGGRLNVTAAVSASGFAETLTASGGTLNLAAGGTLGTGGIVLADVAGGAVRIGGSIASGGTITFAAGGASSQILFDDLGTALSGRTISGFGGSDQIRVAGAASYKVISGGGTTSGTIGAIDSGGGTIEVLTVAGGMTLASNNTIINAATLTASAACYLAGTHIRTADGEVAVEDLTIGDMLVTADGGVQAIRWIGQRAYLGKLVNVHHRAGLMPVRIAAGALADKVPARDLFVSPEHMMAFDGMLVAAHNLVNGTTITRAEDLDVVKYFHIELDQHAVIFAEGAASESYLDTGNRNMFTNVVDYAEIGAAVGSTVPCLPIVSEGPVLAAIRNVIADRAEACGFTASADADLHLLVDGAVIYPSVIAGNSYSFDIAERAGEIRIVSRSVVPAEIEAASADRRRLGVAVAVLTLRGNGLSVDVLAGEKLLADGFYPADGGHRWTNGAALFPTALLGLMHGAFSVTVQLVATGLRYPVAGRGDVVALASARGPRAAGDQRRVA